jgi:hypothetical protein
MMVRMVELLSMVQIVELLFVLLDARERATVRGSFGFRILRDQDGGWLVHYKEAHQQIKTRDKGRE